MQHDSSRLLFANINNLLRTVELNRHITSRAPITSNRKFGSGLVRFVKRIIRWLAFWYIEPVCRQQTEFNNAAVPILGQLTEIAEFLATQAGINGCGENVVDTSITHTNFNEFLHEARSRCIQALHFKVENVLHLGAAGKWYFDWFDENLPHPVASHMGIDLNERPSDLPGNVMWLQQDASDLHNIQSDSVDMVFARQFIEHINAQSYARLLIDIHRVLNDEGIFVVDSPNFAVTNPLGWRHPEHILELTCEQAEQLLDAAGLKIVHQTGLIPQQILPTPMYGGGKAVPIDMHSTKMNIDKAFSARPAECFIWWYVCMKTKRKPDVTRVCELCELFSDQNKSCEMVLTDKIEELGKE